MDERETRNGVDVAMYIDEKPLRSNSMDLLHFYLICHIDLKSCDIGMIIFNFLSADKKGF